jgi:prefoldin alpha subunit
LSREKNKLASKNEEEFRRLNLELRLLEQTAETLQSRMNMINAAATDLRYAKTTLEGLEKENEKSEILVPVGGTSYIRARLDNPNEVIVGMGAGVSVEKTREEAKAIIKRRLEDLEKARASVQQQFAQVAEKINQDREKAEALVAAAREGKTQQDV